MPITNATYADAVDRILILERNLIRARTHFDRIYRNSAKAGFVEGECSTAISAINMTLQESRELNQKIKYPAFRFGFKNQGGCNEDTSRIVYAS